MSSDFSWRRRPRGHLARQKAEIGALQGTNDQASLHPNASNRGPARVSWNAPHGASPPTRLKLKKTQPAAATVSARSGRRVCVEYFSIGSFRQHHRAKCAAHVGCKVGLFSVAKQVSRIAEAGTTLVGPQLARIDVLRNFREFFDWLD